MTRVVQAVLWSVLYALGCVWGVISTLFSLVLGFSSVGMLVAGLVILFFNPGLGIVLIVLAALGVGSIGSSRKRR